MGTEDAGTSRPRLAGWFGKIPALGDFVARRLPAHFIEAWDHWLSTEILATRQALGPDWPPLYLNAPTWCFALMPGVLGTCCWRGVLTPSVDRVGRHFPLTFAVSSEALVLETSGWWAALIAAAARARTPDCDAEALDATLLSTLERHHARPIQDEAGQPLRAALACAGSGDSLWAPWEPESIRFGAVLTFRGLPQGSNFLKLIAGFKQKA
jgi:type VI secretion system ImpM family protein